jgi:hypothetical protein
MAQRMTLTHRQVDVLRWIADGCPAHAERRGAVPAGKRLVVTHERDELRIDLRDAPDGTPTQVLPVPVPERVGRYHPIVAEYRKQHDRHEVSRAQLPRASRILQGLVVEAERRGFTVQGPATSKVREHRRPEWSGDTDGHLRVTVNSVTVTLRIREDGIRSRSIYPNFDYAYRAHDDRARRTTAYEQGAKGTLRISIVAPYIAAHGRSSWGDGKTQELEACLPAVLMEVEARTAQERERLKIAEEEAELRRLEWEDAKAQARHRHSEHQRAQILATQIDAWQHASAIRAYCDAIQQKYPQDGSAVAWAGWARARADAIDPLAMTPTLPEPSADVSPEDLRPFLDGWDPHQPTRRRSII